jgi:hypothetical protein
MSCCGNGSKTPRPAVSGVAPYRPGDTEHPLAWAIRNSLPPAGTVYGQPAVHDDGSLEYTPVKAPPPAVNGYEPDPANPWLLRPLWPECQSRMAGIGKLTDGKLKLVMVCKHTEAKHFQRFVTPGDCQGCPLRVLPEQKQ